VDPQDIEVVIHPQSIIHSMVQFSDGCVMAQLSQPDMRLPIQFALSYPERIDLNTRRIDFAQLAQLTFEKPDLERFPCLGLAYRALEEGGNATCIMNGANEVAVAAFLDGRIRFVDIPEIISETMARCTRVTSPDLEAIYSTDFEAKRIATDYINRKDK
jgi:1-deoxy-D-xylulose-5-phosphate reductoisomerase